MPWKVPDAEVFYEIARQAKAQTRLFRITLVIAIATLLAAIASLIVSAVALAKA
jgi:hypothetical protein